MHQANGSGPKNISRRTLLQEVWGFERPERLETRTVDMHVAKLRKKIEDQPQDPQFIVTVHRVGYRFNG